MSFYRSVLSTPYPSSPPSDLIPSRHRRKKIKLFHFDYYGVKSSPTRPKAKRSPRRSPSHAPSSPCKPRFIPSSTPELTSAFSSSPSAFLDTLPPTSSPLSHAPQPDIRASSPLSELDWMEEEVSGELWGAKSRKEHASPPRVGRDALGLVIDQVASVPIVPDTFPQEDTAELADEIMHVTDGDIDVFGENSLVSETTATNQPPLPPKNQVLEQPTEAKIPSLFASGLFAIQEKPGSSSSLSSAPSKSPRASSSFERPASPLLPQRKRILRSPSPIPGNMQDGKAVKRRRRMLCPSSPSPSISPQIALPMVLEPPTKGKDKENARSASVQPGSAKSTPKLPPSKLAISSKPPSTSSVQVPKKKKSIVNASKSSRDSSSAPSAALPAPTKSKKTAPKTAQEASSGSGPAKATKKKDVVPSSPLTKASSPPPVDSPLPPELLGHLITELATARSSSMTASVLLSAVLSSNTHLRDQRSQAEWLRVTLDVLKSNPVFGRTERTGKDADDEPLEDIWEYLPEHDDDRDRAATLGVLKPRKRGATRKHAQYYWKPVIMTRWADDDF